MPIKVVCKCGKTLAAPDNAAGKAIRCPGCQNPIKVPAANSPAPAKPPAPAKQESQPKATPTSLQSAKQARPQPKAAPPLDDLTDLFDQEGIVARIGPVCPSCDTSIKPGAVICTACGLNMQTGERTQGMAHIPAKSGGHGGGHGNVDGGSALAHAASMMEREQKLEARLAVGGGVPWWSLLIMMMLILGGCSAGALVMISIFTEDASELGTVGRLVQMPGLAIAGGIIAISFGLPYLIGRIVAIVCGFKESIGQGLLVFFIPFYDYYFCAKRWKEYSGVFFMLLITSLGVIVGIVLIAVGSKRG